MNDYAQPDGNWRDVLWRGRDRATPGIVTLFWVIVRLLLSNWLWGTALRLAPFPSPIKMAALVLALVSIFLFLWGLWGFFQAIRRLGVRRLLVIFIIGLMIVLTINLLTIPDERPLGSRLLYLARTTVGQVGDRATRWGSSVSEAPDSFLRAYSGQSSAPALPEGFPTPNPQATPIQAFVRPSSE